MQLLEDLQWRYATKRYINKPISEEEVSVILETIRLTATSLGLQPFEIYDVRSTEVRAKLREAAYNQPQLTEASHVFVFAVWTEVTEEMVDSYLNFIATTREKMCRLWPDFARVSWALLAVKTPRKSSNGQAIKPTSLWAKPWWQLLKCASTARQWKVSTATSWMKFWICVQKLACQCDVDCWVSRC